MLLKSYGEAGRLLRLDPDARSEKLQFRFMARVKAEDQNKSAHSCSGKKKGRQMWKAKKISMLESVWFIHGL